MAVTPTTWNPADKAAGATLSNGNLTFAGNVDKACRSVFSASSGKWYWEITLGSGSNPIAIGIGKSSASLTAYLGGDANGIGWYGDVHAYYVGGSSTSYGTTSGTGDIIGVALDLDSGTLALYRNGSAMGVMATGLSGTWFAMTSGNAATASDGTANFGASAFAYTPPTGFQAGFGEPLATYALSGLIRDASGDPAARTVRAFREDTGAFVGTAVSDGTTGAYSIATIDDSAHTLVAYPADGEALPALVLRSVIPVET